MYGDDEVTDEDVRAFEYLVNHRPEQRSPDGHVQMSLEEFQRRDERYQAAFSKIANRPAMQRYFRRLWRSTF